MPAKFGCDNRISQTLLCEQNTPTAFYRRVQTLEVLREKILFPTYVLCSVQAVLGGKTLPKEE